MYSVPFLSLMVLLSRSFQFWCPEVYISFSMIHLPQDLGIYPACSSERFLKLCLEFSTIQDKIHFSSKFFLLLFLLSTEADTSCILNHLTLSHRSLSFHSFFICFSLYTSVWNFLATSSGWLTFSLQLSAICLKKWIFHFRCIFQP